MATHIDLPLKNAITDIKIICDRPESKSQYFPFGGEGYKSCVRHFLESSCEIAACGVQPGSVTDLCEIVKVIKKYRVPFAIKGGGHATSPGLSSTTGIQISMCRFNKIRVEKDTDSFLPPRSPKHSLAHIGAGCLFDEVYREVVPNGLNIVGGSSIGGVGIGGWLLGGGYSLKTNQYGMGIDNIMRVQIVLPSGESKEVSVLSQGEDKELFEAVKGGRDNFGIVTEFTIKTHAQAKQVYGCLLAYESEEHEEVKVAVAKFAKQNDPKASIVAAFRYSSNPGSVQSKLTVQCFYDGPKPKTNPFAEFMKIEHETVSGGGDTVGHESPLASALSNRMYSDYNSDRSMISPAHGQSQPGPQSEESFSELQEYSSYEEFDQQFSLINEVLDTNQVNTETIHPISLYGISSMEGVASQPGVYMNYTTSAYSVMSRSAPGTARSMEILNPSSRDRIKQSMTGVGENPRGRWGNVMVDVYTKEIIDEIGRQASKASKHMLNHGGKKVVIDIWPFTNTMFNNSTPSAWPHSRGSQNGPILAYFLWEGSGNDDFWILLMESALAAIKKKVKKARGPNAKPLPVYSNTTLRSTTVEEIYGENLDKLKGLRKKFDPELVMDLAGSFKFSKIPHPLEEPVNKEPWHPNGN